MDLGATIDPLEEIWRRLEEIWIDLESTIDPLDENSKSSGRFPLSTFVEALGLK